MSLAVGSGGLGEFSVNFSLYILTLFNTNHIVFSYHFNLELLCED